VPYKRTTGLFLYVHGVNLQEVHVSGVGLLEREYEPHVITAISATDMVNFFPFPHTVPGYPLQPDAVGASTSIRAT